jgi:hypothetical protein
MAPSVELGGISGVESGKAAPLVGGPPGVELHTVIDELPSGSTGDRVPILLPMIGEEMVPRAVAGGGALGEVVMVDRVIAAVPVTIDVETVLVTVDSIGTGVAVIEGGGRAGTAGGGGAGTVEPAIVDRNEVAGCADSVRNGTVGLLVVDVAGITGTAGIDVEADGGGPDVPPLADMELTGTAGVPGAICPVGVEQVTTVPGVVGSEASGTGASVVSAVPAWVADENGLGPLSGDVTIAPGVDASPMAVLPMVETCARQSLQAVNSMAVVSSKRSIVTSPSLPI